MFDAKVQILFTRFISVRCTLILAGSYFRGDLFLRMTSAKIEFPGYQYSWVSIYKRDKIHELETSTCWNLYLWSRQSDESLFVEFTFLIRTGRISWLLVSVMLLLFVMTVMMMTNLFNEALQNAFSFNFPPYSSHLILCNPIQILSYNFCQFYQAV